MTSWSCAVGTAGLIGREAEVRRWAGMFWCTNNVSTNLLSNHKLCTNLYRKSIISDNCFEDCYAFLYEPSQVQRLMSLAHAAQQGLPLLQPFPATALRAVISSTWLEWRRVPPRSFIVLSV